MHRSLCICALLPRIATRTRVVVVLHQLEARKPTNTGALAAKCLENSVVVYRGRAPGGATADPLDHQLSSETDPLLLYPHPSATPLAGSLCAARERMRQPGGHRQAARPCGW